MMKDWLSQYLAALILAATSVWIGPASAQPQALGIDQWRADLRQIADSIRKIHPAPFRKYEESKFNAAVGALHRDIPKLTDKMIVVRMAEIVGLLKDGHTRLALPRMHPDLGLEFGHTTTKPANSALLTFKQLPFAFEQYKDGLFVIGASKPYANHIGGRVVSIGGKPASAAMQAVQRITFAESAQLQKLMGADRLTLPETLEALGITQDASKTPVVVQGPDGSNAELVLAPLPEGDIVWRQAPFGARLPLRLQNSDKQLWSTYLNKENIVYARINRIGDAEITLASFSTSIIEEAERRDARLVIDLRRNFGGDGNFNRTLILGLIQSAELNVYGRTFVLIGRRSFSATQHLVNMLEMYTRALFVGEPTGARPDHFGDSRKVRLENSGLTLRVSSLHWSSLIANDTRDSTNPDLPAPWTSKAYFSGSDPALAAVIAYKPPRQLRSLVGPALRKGDHYQVYRYLSMAKLSPLTHKDDFSDELLLLGREFESERKYDLARFAYRYGLNYFPQDTDLQAALKGLGED